MTKLATVSVALMICAAFAVAQDYRNNMFNVRGTAYDGKGPRGEEVTVVDPKLKPFYHGVASGDPTQTSVIVWTRITPESGETSIPYTLKVWVAGTNPVILVSVVYGQALLENDYCVKVDVKGLQPGTSYNYMFESGGKYSLIGRTRTAPAGSTNQVRFAIVSCSNFPAGFFNTYNRIAARNDLDAVIHLGDYIYEYDADSSSYGGQVGIMLGRQHEPDAELLTLADYRTRYAQYRLDPDLRRLHQEHPMIHVWDDHESANDSYVDGAENHQPNEGSWAVRKAISRRVQREWMPIRDAQDGHIYRQFTFGNLVDLFVLDTRLDGRQKQVQGVGSLSTQASRDSLNDPNRKMISSEQYDWLTAGLSDSEAKWRVIGNQVFFTPITVAPLDTAFLFQLVGPAISSILRPQVPYLTAVLESAFYGDTWNNYPAQRAALASFLKTTNTDCNVIVSGDFHTAFLFDGNWPQGAQPLVEFVGPSVTSNNFDDNLQADPTLAPLTPALIATLQRTLATLNPHLKWFDLTRHGYMLLDLNPNRAQCDWFMVDTILARSEKESFAFGAVHACGSNVTIAEMPAPGKPLQDASTPVEPPVTAVEGDHTQPSPLTILGHGANPASTAMYVTFVVERSGPVHARLVGTDGSVVRESSIDGVKAGLNTWSLDLHDVASGSYQLSLEQDGAMATMTVVIQR